MAPEVPTFLTIPAGLLPFAMEDAPRPAPVHVAAFLLAATQTTNAQYRLFARAAGHAPPPLADDPDFSAPDQPVVSVSWFDAEAYCAWLAVELGAACRFPSEAEWEWAARGGLVGARYPWGDEPPESHYPDYVSLWRRGPEPVGRHLSNAYGLHEMCENTHEWCAEWFDAARTRKASKGGSWRHQNKVSTCAARSSIPPHFKYADYGFRVAI